MARQAARLFVPRAGQEPREPARWRGKPRDCLSQGLGKARGRATPLRSTALPRPFPSPWGQALLVLAQPLGAGTLCSCPALGGRHPLFLPGPLGCPFIRPCLPPCVVTFVNAFHVEHYICKCLQVQPLPNVNTSPVCWFTFVYCPVNQAVVAHLYALSLLFLCSPRTFVNACRRNYPFVISICQCLQMQLSACHLHLSTAHPSQGPAPGLLPPGPRPGPRPSPSPAKARLPAFPHPGQGPAAVPSMLCRRAAVVK